MLELILVRLETIKKTPVAQVKCEYKVKYVPTNLSEY